MQAVSGWSLSQWSVGGAAKFRLRVSEASSKRRDTGRQDREIMNDEL